MYSLFNETKIELNKWYIEIIIFYIHKLHNQDFFQLGLCSVMPFKK